MNTLLFFDDQRLFNRTNVTRQYGIPELIEDAVFYEKNASVSIGFPSVWNAPDGKYHMFYQGFLRGEDYKVVTLAAISSDGIHWEPRNTAREAGIQDPICDNQLLPFFDGELASVIEDKAAPEDQRLKALITVYRRDSHTVDDLIYVSGDGIHWALCEDIRWNDRGAEPGAGGFYCETRDSFVITARPGWGVRRICSFETKDFIHFTKPELAIQCDSIDEPLIETYGMPSFSYKGWYIGLLWIYHTLSENRTKYMGGTMDCQLAYSLNGLHWQRSLRYPFIPNGKDGSPTSGMVFPSAVRLENGQIIIYASATPHEHGYFIEDGACIVSYTLREDGFICLKAGDEPGSIFTRQMLLNSGNFSINIKCTDGQATCAVYDMYSNPIEGFGHADCIPFSGDSTAWNPVFRSGRKVEELAGNIVTLEITFSNGELYAISGDYVHMMNQEAERYKKFGILPDTRGF